MFYLLIFNFEFLIINYYLLFRWGKPPPKLHPCLCPALAGYPLLGVPGEPLSVQLPPSSRAHPQTSLNIIKLSEFLLLIFYIFLNKWFIVIINLSDNKNLLSMCIYKYLFSIILFIFFFCYCFKIFKLQIINKFKNY